MNTTPPTTPLGSGQPAPARPRFKLWPVSFVVFILGAGGLLAFDLFRKGDAGATSLSYTFGSIVGIMLLCALVGTPVYFLTKRSSGVANGAILGLLLLGLAGQFASRATKNNREVQREFFADAEAHKQAALQEATEKGFIEDFDKKAADSAARLEAASRNMTGLDAKVAAAGAALVKTMSKFTSPHNEGTRQIVASGGLDLTSIKNAADAQARLGVFESFGKVNADLLAFMRRMDAETRAEMKAAGVPDEKLAEVVGGFLRGMKLPTLIAMREDDEKFVQTTRDYFGVLIKHDGKWTVSAEGNVEFDEAVPEDDIARFNDAATKANEIAAHQTQLLEQLKQ